LDRIGASSRLAESNCCRACSMAGQFDQIQPVNASSAGSMLRPIALSSYSTRGGGTVALR
jgi:hypothetical protein